MIDSIDWAAGILEGEGNFRSVKRIRTRLNKSDTISYDFVIQLGMSDSDIVKRVYQTLGVGNFNGPYYFKNGNKPMWRWAVTKRRDVLKVAYQLLPFLGERRTLQVDHLIGMIELHEDLYKIGSIGRWKTV